VVVQFWVDGMILGAEDTTNDYSVAWDTTTATDGAHTLAAVARDAAGNTTTSSSVIVTVDNTVPPPPPPPSGNVAYLSDLAERSSVSGWGPMEKDRSNGETGATDGNTITLNGTTYSKGLGVHAYSEVIYDLDGSYSNFRADIGVDDEVGSLGSVTFSVLSGNTTLYDSGNMTGSSATKSVDLNIAGVTELKLIVTDSGDGVDYDHADWADAHLVRSTDPPNPPTNLEVR